MAAEDRQAQIAACRSLSQSSEASPTTGSAVPIGKATAAASAAAAVYTVTAAMDVAALREDVSRLGTQVHTLEEQVVGRGGLQELESKVDNLGRSFAVLKEQMHTMVRERQLDLLRERKETEQRCESSTTVSSGNNSSGSVIAAMRQELDDFRARWMQLARQVDEQSRATSMCVSAIAELRGDSSASTSVVATDVAALRSELSDHLVSAIAQAMHEARRDMQEFAKESSNKAAKDAAWKAAHDAAKEAAKIAANETAREVAHVAAVEAVEATAEKARQAAREVACEELAMRYDERGAPAPGTSVMMWKELRGMLTAAIATVEDRQAALTSEMHMVQKDLRSELSAAVAAMSKEVTTACVDTGRAVDCCKQDIQNRYAELLRLQLEALPQERLLEQPPSSVVATVPDEQAIISTPAESDVSLSVPQTRAAQALREVGNTVQELMNDLPKVAALDAELASLSSKLQKVEKRLLGDSPVAVEDSRVEGLRSSPREAKAPSVEPALSTQKAAEELRIGLRSELARLEASKPTIGPCDDCEERRSHFDHRLAIVLADEFETVHSKKLKEMALALGEEFAVVFEENQEMNMELASEFRESYAQLFHVVRELERRQVELEELQRRQSSTVPPNAEKASKVATDSKAPIANVQSSGGQGRACVPFDAMKFEEEQELKLDRMAKYLGEEFETVHHVRMTDALDVLGEEFDKVREPLEMRLDDLQNDQDTLHGGLVSYVELARQNHERLAALEQTVQEVMQRQTAHASELALIDAAAKSQQLAQITHIAEYLGEEFDRAHSEKAQPIESCLLDLRDNQLWLAAAVQALQQQVVLPGGNGCSLEDLKKQLVKLYKVVQDMIEDPKVQMQVNSRTTASPKGRLQQSPGINSQESTSDSKRELHGKRSPDEMSGALSERSSLHGGEWDLLHDKVLSLPVELQALRSENGACVNPSSAEVLAEKQNYDRLSSMVAKLQASQSSLASELELLRERCSLPIEDGVAQTSLQKGRDKKVSLASTEATSGVRGELNKLLGTQDVTDMIVKMAGLPKELEAMRRDQNLKLKEIAESLGEEFQHAAGALEVRQENFSIGVSSDMVYALGEEFDKVYDENNQLLQSKIEAIRETQAKLVEIVFRQECYSTLAENANPAEKASNAKSNAQTQFEGLCCFVRSEIASKVDALREELAAGLRDMSATQQDLALPCKVAGDQAVRRHIAAREEIAGGHLDAPASLPEQEENVPIRDGHTNLEPLENHFRSQSLREAHAQDGQAGKEVVVPSDLVSTLQDTTLRAQEIVLEVGQDGGHLNYQTESSGFFTLGREQFESITPDLTSDLQPSEFMQREALRKVMDDELRRARMALESMPNFGGAADQNGVDAARIHSQALDVPEVLELGDPEETALRERWPVLYVLPGLRSMSSEDTPAAQSKQPANTSVPEKDMAPRPILSASPSSANATTVTVPIPAAVDSSLKDLPVSAAPSNVAPSPLAKPAVELLGPERTNGTTPEVAQT